MSEQGLGDAESTGAPAGGDPGSTAQNRSAKKTPAKKTTAKKVTAKKAAAKKATTKKAAPKKTTAKKAAKKASPAKKASTSKPAPPAADVGKQAVVKVVPTPAMRARAQVAQPPAAQAEAAPADADPPEPPRRPVPAAEAFPPAGEIDRPWLASYPPLVPESYPYPDVPLTRLLDDAAKDFPDSVAMDFLGRTTTYRRLLDQVDRFSTALQAMGVVPGDRVGIALPNCPQYVIAFFAALRAGAVVVGIDPGLDENGLALRINDAGCRVLVVLDPVYAKVERLKGRVPSVEHVVGTAVADYLTPLAATAFNFRHRKDRRLVHKIPATEGVLRFTDLVRRHPPTATQAPLSPTDAAALVAYPSDGVGPLRGVVLTHRNLLTNVFQVRLWIPDVQAGRETILCAVPFWQPYGLTTGLSLGVLSAATMALAPSLERDDVLAVIDKRHPTLFPATGGLIERLVSAPHLRKHELTSIRAALCDTSLLAPDVVATFEEATGGRLREGLAVPEAAALTHANPVYGKAKAERVGLPLTDTMCVLVDPRDRSRLAAPGERGELAVSGPQVMKGYWKAPAESDATVVDGWLLTGYLAEVDRDGYYAILGRIDAPTPGDDQGRG